MEYVLSLIDYEDIKSVKPSFYDLQGVVSYSVSPKNKSVSYTHLRAHETVLDLVCRLLLEKKKKIT